jgi:hypothetical protein
MRQTGVRKELESEFGVGGETEGTLVLTNKRLIFVTTDVKEVDLPEPGALNPLAEIGIYFSEVEEIDSIPTVPGNVFIQIMSIVSVTGRNPELERPHLQVTWVDGVAPKSSLFVETLTGRSRKKNLSDWVGVIERLKAGTQKLIPIPSTPSMDTLEGKIMRVMADMQSWGPFTIERMIEDTLKVKVEEDAVEDACEKLVSMGALKSEQDGSGEVYYRKTSPLGPDDLSV